MAVSGGAGNITCSCGIVVIGEGVYGKVNITVDPMPHIPCLCCL